MITSQVLAKLSHHQLRDPLLNFWVIFSDTNTSSEVVDYIFPSCVSSVRFGSVAQSCPILCDPMNHSMPALSVHHQLPEFTQTHVHWVGDAIQSSHPLSSPSPPAFNLSQHKGFCPLSQLFASGGQSIETSASALVLPMNIQDWFPLGWTGWISLQFKGLSRVFSNNTVQKHQFLHTQLSL